MAESNPYDAPKADATTPDAGTPPSQSVRWPASSAQGSLKGAAILIAFDVLLSGSFLASYLVCPVWFLVSVVKNVIQRPGWRIALFRISVPVLTLGIVLGINAIQWKIADVNAERIINACEEFHVANERYPQTLNELVPRNLGSIPRAKYCLFQGEFVYYYSPDEEGSHFLLWWYRVPPFGKEVYSSKDRRWTFLD